MVMRNVIDDIVDVIVYYGYIVISFALLIGKVGCWAGAETVLLGFAWQIFGLVLFPLIAFKSFSGGHARGDEVSCAS